MFLFRLESQTSGCCATYVSQRLIMGSCFLSQWGYLDFFTEMFIEQSSMFHKTFVLVIAVQIAEFDWLPGRQKNVNFREKMSKQIR